MKPATFEYHRPETVAAAVELLDRHHEDGELMAGNQSLGIVLSTRLATPDHVIDVNRIDELATIAVNEATEEAKVGALVRHREIERSGALADHCPMFPAAAGQIAGPSVRNRGTFGGSIGEADPAGNYPCAMVALDGTITLESVDGTREVDARDYFRGYMFTAREENELITGGTVDLSPFPRDRSGMAFDELKPAEQTWPTVSAAAAVRVDGDGVVEEARLALANAAEVPLHVPGAEAAVEGTTLDDPALDAVGEAVATAADPDDELHADAEFKAEAAAEYARRALSAAHDRAG